ncbi:unnamed protein product [Withania somnifera]
MKKNSKALIFTALLTFLFITTTGGFGFGPGGPKTGYAKGGIIRPTIVCKDKGPCLGKKLRCPSKCFKSFSRAGKGYGYGGGCTMDCKKKCFAYC